MKTYSSTLQTNDRQNVLSKYFQEMAVNSLLSAEEEASLAKEIRESEENIWEALLSYAPTVPSFSKTIRENISDKTKISFRTLRNHANSLKKKPSPKMEGMLYQTARTLAQKLRVLDPDQKIVKILLKRIDNNLVWNTQNNQGQNTGRLKLKISHSRRLASKLRNTFVESNLGLVITVARRYQFSGMGLPDLIQEGNLGLLKAVSRFDERKGFRFSTYATWWIRHSIGRSVSDKSRTVRIPVHVLENNQKISKIKKELTATLGRPATTNEISIKADLSIAKVERIISNANTYSISLDAPIGKDGERERMEVFSTSSSNSPYEQMARHSINKQAKLALNTLAPIEIEILHRRFGLAGKTATTLQEIANAIGKSRERIRQIQEKALLKLRENLIAQQAV